MNEDGLAFCVAMAEHGVRMAESRLQDTEERLTEIESVDSRWSWLKGCEFAQARALADARERLSDLQRKAAP